MNFETLEKMWAQQTTHGTLPAAAALAAAFQRDVQTAERRIRGGIVMVGGLLALDIVLSIVAHTTGIKRITPIGAVAELTFFALYALFFFRAFRSAGVVRQERAALGGTLPEAATAALRTVELQIANTRIAGVAIPLVVAISAWLLEMKHLTGELRAAGVIGGTLFMALLGLALGAAFWHRYRTRLDPRRAELRELLRMLADEPRE